MRYGSLFTGIGGIDLGMDMAGLECAWQVEIDDHCTRILEKRWPDVKRYRDIFELDASQLEPVDLICGGFPCQPVSVAGKRAGASDERWLWPEFARIIRHIGPRWVVAENVPGLLSANSGREFAEVLGDLAEGGYDVVWDVFPAGGPGGVGAPHRRERIFIVAHTNGYKQAENSSNLGEVSGVPQEVGKDISAVVSGGGSEYVADTNGHVRRAGSSPIPQGRKAWMEHGGGSKGQPIGPADSDVAHSSSEGLQGCGAEHELREVEEEEQIGRGGWWEAEPDVGRVADGIPNQAHRIKMLGNAVVPQVARQIGEMILDTDN